MKPIQQFLPICALFFAVTGGVIFLSLPGQTLSAQEAGTTKLTVESLGGILQSLGLQVTSTQTRYDFRFSSTLEGEQWNLTMSAVLSQDGETLWVMAWLDKLPDSASDVPVPRLLEMLAANDRMGNGKFFSYLSGSRRFALQRVIPNHNLNKATLAAALQDLGVTVRSEYTVWAVDGWSETSAAAPATDLPMRNAVNDSKFDNRAVR